MEEVKITFFKDKKITKNQPSALLEFSDGTNFVVSKRYETDIAYAIQKVISEKIHTKGWSVFQQL